MRHALFALLIAAFATPAFANAGHSGPEPVGEPGKKSEATRTFKVVMKETDDGQMVFSPTSFKIRKGQTVVFDIKNTGELDHEFILDSKDKILEHKAVMEKFPEMEHDDANAIRLKPGASGQIVWKFVNDGDFEIACLVPGHMQSGMRADVVVAGK
jgi:uncharacterized cupredoxin-like copper-binding protein